MFDLRTLRLAVGESHRQQVPLALVPFTVGGQRYEPVPARVDGDLSVTRLASGMLFDLRFSAEAFGPCQRCLEEARVTLDAGSREYHAHQPEPEAEDEMITPYLQGDLLDVDRWAEDALVLSMPPKVLCREDCAGLCPSCGQNLNDGSCSCTVEVHDERWAKLKDLL
jgi:uncharacterized protein